MTTHDALVPDGKAKLGEAYADALRAPEEELNGGQGDGGYVIDDDLAETDEEEEEEEEEGEEENGIMGQAEGSAAAKLEIEDEWVSLENHPVQTSQRIQAALARLASSGRKNLTILLLGRKGAGKSSTANSVFGSRLFAVAPPGFLNYAPDPPSTVSKRKAGVVVTIMDTPGLVESDSVSDTALRHISFAVQSSTSSRTRRPIDIVLYMDRMDMPQVEDLDHEAFEAVTNTFGPQIWKNVMIGLSRSEVRNPAPWSCYDQFVDKRLAGIRAAMQKAGAPDAASIPYALIENSSLCQKNEDGELVVPNGSAWVPALVERAVDLALRQPKGYSWSPNKRNLIRRCILLPLLFIGQILFKLMVIDKIIEEDGVKGDQYGPYDIETQKEERRRVQERKVLERQQREEAKRRARKARQRKQAELEGVTDSDSEEDDEDYY
eukprot:evm.model.scf_419EXC.2 EVM.evm.TU.scf_419EXC.2   scf_419EXC:8706-17095(-)